MGDVIPGRNPNGGGLVPRVQSNWSDELAVEPPTLRSYLGAIRRKLWVVVLGGLIGWGLSAAVIQLRDPSFTSATVIQLPQESSGGGQGGLAGLAASMVGGAGSLESQVQVIMSRLLLGEVVDSLGLRLHREVSDIPRDKYRPVGWLDDVRIDPTVESGVLGLAFGDDAVQATWAGETLAAGYGQLVDFGALRFRVEKPAGLDEVELYVVDRNAAIGALQGEMRVWVREGTNILDIVVTGYDPQITRKVADVTAAEYREYTGMRSREEAERRRQYLEEQLATTEELLRQTQDELTVYRQREGLYSAQSQAEADQGSLSELDLREADLLAERQMAQSLLQRVRGGEASTGDVLRALIASPSMAQNPAVRATFDRVAISQAHRDSLLNNGLAPSNQNVARLNQQIELAERDMLAATQGHLDMIQAQLSAIEMVRSRIDRRFSQLAGTEPEEVRLTLRMEATSEAVSELRAQYVTAGVAEASALEPVAILDPALQGNPTGAGPGRTLLFGLILGFMAGGAGAILLDSADRSIRRREDVERVLRVPGLGIIPSMNGRSTNLARRLPVPVWVAGGNGVGAGRHGLVVLEQRDSPGAEAFRTLRTNLAGSLALASLKTVLVTSPSGSEGKTTTAANLAVTFANQGQRVLLIDCDLRQPTLHDVFAVSREPGLSDVLGQGLDVSAAIQPTRVDRLSILPAGRLPDLSAADLLTGGSLRGIFDQVESLFDLVILDSPPVLLTADALILATQVDGALVVVRAGQTERDSALYAVQQLESVGATVVGAVLNDSTAEAGRAGRYATAG